MSNENKFDQEVLSLSMTTAVRLLKLEGSDPFTLYSFLATHAKLQDTNKVWANQNFCKKGLGWGQVRVDSAKKMLEDQGFIQLIPAKQNEETGLFGKSYVHIEYINNPKYRYPVTADGGTAHGSQDTNACNKKLNAYNKNKDNLSTSVDKVASDTPPESFLLPDGVEKYEEGLILNKYWKDTGLKRGHRSLESKFLISGKYGGSERKSLPVWAPITSAIRMTGMKSLKKAIRNYKAYQDAADEYTGSAKLSLGEFCHDEQYKQYINSVPLNEFQSTNPWDIIRKLFSPLTSVYDVIFDQKTQRYYGFRTESIESSIRWEDTEQMMKVSNEKWDFNAFMELEWMIAGLLWRRKKADRENDLEICQKYMDRWNELIPQFKKRARKWLKEDFELYG